MNFDIKDNLDAEKRLPSFEELTYWVDLLGKIEQHGILLHDDVLTKVLKRIYELIDQLNPEIPLTLKKSMADLKANMTDILCET